jgi:pimeloyl-ACP methyl ester carboxylesterase
LKKGYAETAGGQIHYIVDGYGPPIILLHQMPTSSAEFSLVLPYLNKQYRAIAMDIPGYGDSESPTRAYNLNEYAQAVIALMDSLGLDKVNLVGHHTGAGIATEAAAAFPGRVKSLVVSGFPLFNREELKLRRSGQVPDFLKKSEPLVLRKNGFHLIDLWSQAERIFNFGRGEAPPGKAPTPEVLQMVAMAMMKSGPRNLEGHQALWNWEPSARTPLIGCPTLILVTPEDQFYGRETATKALISGSKVKVVKDGGAYFPVQSPSEYADAIVEFLGSLPP